MYAFDISTGDDWGDGPIVETGYDYPSPTAALGVAIQQARELGLDWGTTGVNIYKKSTTPDEDGDPITWQWTAQAPAVLYGWDANHPDVNVAGAGIDLPPTTPPPWRTADA